MPPLKPFLSCSKNLKLKLVGGAPRLRFFKSKEDWEKNTVDAGAMTIEEMQV